MLYNELIFCDAIAFFEFFPVNVSLGIDNKFAFCVFGLYDATIIVSVSSESRSVLTPNTNTFISFKSFFVFSSWPTTVASIPLSPPPFLIVLYVNHPIPINNNNIIINRIFKPFFPFLFLFSLYFLLSFTFCFLFKIITPNFFTFNIIKYVPNFCQKS